MVNVLETDRLVLREMQRSDLDALAAIYVDPQVMRFVGSGEAKTRKQTANSISWMRGQYRAHKPCLWATVRKEDNTLIGRCGIIEWDLPWDFELEVAFLFGRPWWGFGYATEAAIAIRNHAFARYDIPQLISLVYPQNTASIRVIEKTDMTFWREHEFEGERTVKVFRIKRHSSKAA